VQLTALTTQTLFAKN